MFFFYMVGHLSFEELEIQLHIKLSHDQTQLNSGQLYSDYRRLQMVDVVIK